MLTFPRHCAGVAVDASDIARGVAIFVGDNPDVVPAAFRLHVADERCLYENVIFLAASVACTPRIAPLERVTVQRPAVGAGAGCRFHFITVQFGFREECDIPAALHRAWLDGQVDFDPRNARYVCADQLVFVQRGAPHRWHAWRRMLFVAMARRQTSVRDFFRLPSARTVSYLVPVGL
jgi:KUP system potassium uptake protein